MPDVVSALDDLQSSLAWPDPDVAVTDRAVVGLGSRLRPRWPVAAVVAVFVVGVGVPVAARHLSLGGVRIERSSAPAPAELGRKLELGRPTPVRVDAPRPPSLGPPAAAFEGRPAGGYTEVWPGPTLVTSFPGRLAPELIEKRSFQGGTIEATTVDGALAYWISGPHGFLYLDDRGDPIEDTLRLSGSALVWTRDGITYRLESDRTLAESVALAEGMF